MITIAIVNQKGGVGKTTSAINLATGVAAVGLECLLIDLDPQGNASTGLGVPHTSRVASSYDLLLGMRSMEEVVHTTSVPKLDLVPATQDLSGAEIELVQMDDRSKVLREAIACDQRHQICIIDCPPSLGLLTLNALCAANFLLVPLQCEFFALEGLSQLLQTVEQVQQRFNPALEILGVALTMFDRRNSLTNLVAQDVRGCLGNLVFETVIPRNVRLSEAPSHGLPAMIYDQSCAGSRAYMDLARELIGRLPRERKPA